jgi:hypothetical protein
MLTFKITNAWNVDNEKSRVSVFFEELNHILDHRHSAILSDVVSTWAWM